MMSDSYIGSIVFLIIGLGFLIKGGDLLVDGAVNIARKFAIPMSFIGLTIVAFGTSAPELFTSTYAGLQGQFDIAITNVLGSNIFNICIVIGFVSLLHSFVITKRTFIWDWIWLVATSLLLLFFAHDLQIERYEGLILFFLYILFISLTWKRFKNDLSDPDDQESKPTTSNAKDSIYILLGLVGLIVGTRFALTGGVQLGALIGLSERVIGLLILSTGTSLPELMTSLVAAYKGHNNIAISNVTGSNMANLLVVLGISSSLNPFTISDVVLSADVYMTIIITLLLGALVYLGKFKFTKWQGLILVSIYSAYFYTLTLL